MTQHTPIRSQRAKTTDEFSLPFFLDSAIIQSIFGQYYAKFISMKVLRSKQNT